MSALKFCFLLCLLASIGTASSRCFANTSANDHFRAGVQAFEAGHYQAALSAFRRANDHGLNTPALHYNLGVSAYRSGDYPSAWQAFSELLNTTEWRALAHYNLALVAEKVGNLDQARHHYMQARTLNQDNTVTQLSTRALARLSPTSAHTEALLSLALGYDSHPAQQDIPGLHRNPDLFSDIYGYVSQRMSDSSWRMDGVAYLRRYNDNEFLNDTSLQAAMLYENLWQGWHTEAGPTLGLSYANEEHYQTRLEGRALARRTVSGQGTLSVSTDLTAITTPSNYARSRGWQARATTSWSGAWHTSWYRLQYRAEWNDRNDSDPVNNQASLSSLRQRLRAVAGTPLAASWWGEVGLEYELSQYHHDDLFDNELIRRRDKQSRFQLRAGRPLAKQWQHYVEAGLSLNQSNADAFDINRVLVQWVLEYRH